MTNQEQAVGALGALGLNRLECEIYVALIRYGPLGGYRLAQILNRPDANVYKALVSLAEKRAVLLQPGDPKIYRAVPFDDFARSVEANLNKRLFHAKNSLSRIRAMRRDDWALYQLPSRTQVEQKALALFSGSRSVIVVDMSPPLVSTFRLSLENASKRGVTVLLKVYEPTSIPGVVVAYSPQSTQAFQRWKADWINAVVDGEFAILSLIDQDKDDTVVQAIWTESRYLSWVFHSALWAEASLTQLEGMDNTEASPLSLREGLRNLVPLPLPPSHHAIHHTQPPKA